MKHLAEALDFNKVRLEQASYLVSSALRSSQTLTTLNLGGNRFEAEGTRPLADALNINKVKLEQCAVRVC